MTCNVLAVERHAAVFFLGCSHHPLNTVVMMAMMLMATTIMFMMTVVLKRTRAHRAQELPQAAVAAGRSAAAAVTAPSPNNLCSLSVLNRDVVVILSRTALASDGSRRRNVGAAPASPSKTLAGEAKTLAGGAGSLTQPWY